MSIPYLATLTGRKAMDAHCDDGVIVAVRMPTRAKSWVVPSALMNGHQLQAAGSMQLAMILTLPVCAQRFFASVKGVAKADETESAHKEMRMAVDRYIVKKYRG